jgi:hypothetical protein
MTGEKINAAAERDAITFIHSAAAFKTATAECPSVASINATAALNAASAECTSDAAINANTPFDASSSKDSVCNDGNDNAGNPDVDDFPLATTTQQSTIYPPETTATLSMLMATTMLQINTSTPRCGWQKKDTTSNASAFNVHDDAVLSCCPQQCRYHYYCPQL